MVDLEREKDPEVLRQAARLLEAENRRLVARVMELTTTLLKAQGKCLSGIRSIGIHAPDPGD